MRNFSMPSKPSEGCTFIRRPVQYNRIEVKGSNNVVVIGPDKRDMINYLEKRQHWINQKTRMFKELESRATIRPEKILFLGKWYSVKHFQDMTHSELRRGFREPLRIHAEAFFDGFCSAPKVKIRKMHSKYGSFSSKKDEAALSVYLSLLPKNLIEYVCFHEYVHRFEKGHSARFWEAVQTQYTDYLSLEKQLKIWWLRKDRLVRKYPILESI